MYQFELVVPVWGDESIRDFCEFSIASMLASQNLSVLSVKNQFSITIATYFEDKEKYSLFNEFNELARLTSIKFHFIDHLKVFKENHAKLQMAYLDCMLVSSTGISNKVFILGVADYVYSNNTFHTVVNKMSGKNNSLLSFNIRSNKTATIAEFKRIKTRNANKKGTVIDISPRRMADLCLKNIHDITACQILNKSNKTLVKSWDGFYWANGPQSLIVSKMNPHLLAVKPDSLNQYAGQKIGAPFDYNWFETLCKNPLPLYVEDSDDICICEPSDENYGIDNIVNGSIYENLEEFLDINKDNYRHFNAQHLRMKYHLHSIGDSSDLVKAKIIFDNKCREISEALRSRVDATIFFSNEVPIFKNWMLDVVNVKNLKDIQRLPLLKYIIPFQDLSDKDWINITTKSNQLIYSENIYPHYRIRFPTKRFFDPDSEPLPYEVRIIIPVWGSVYIANFFSMLLPSISSSVDLKSLSSKRVALCIMTDDVDPFMQSTEFLEFAKVVDVHFYRGEPQGENNYSKLINATNLALSEISDEVTCFFLLPDQIYSTGSIKYALESIELGKKAVIVPNIRVNKNGVVQFFNGCISNDIKYSPRRVVSYLLRNPHPMTVAQTINSQYPLGFKNVARIFTSVHNKGIPIGYLASIFSGNAFCVRVDQSSKFTDETYDGGLVSNIIYEASQIDLIQDSDIAISIECSDSHYSEGFNVHRGRRSALLLNTSRNLFNGWFRGFHIWQFDRELLIHQHSLDEHPEAWRIAQSELRTFKAKLFKISSISKIRETFGPDYRLIFSTRLLTVRDQIISSFYLSQIKRIANKLLKILNIK